MRRRWKVAMGLGAALTLCLAGGITWIVMQKPPTAVIADPGPTGKRIAANGLLANFYPATGPGPHAAILLIGGSEGGLSSAARAQALLLQDAGFSVLQLAYHNAPGRPPKIKNVPLETFYAGLDWLKQQPNVDGDRLGIVGYSKGAEAGLLVATRYRGVDAAVLAMPSNVVWDGMSGENYLLGSFSSSWSQGGTPLAHLGYTGSPDANGIKSVFSNSLRKLKPDDAAIIPVEMFAGALMLVCGEADKLWPSCPMADAIAARARDKGSRQPIVLRYKDAGHAAVGAPPSDVAAARRWPELGGSLRGNMAARADSWPRIVEFLKRHLQHNGTAAPTIAAPIAPR